MGFARNLILTFIGLVLFFGIWSLFFRPEVSEEPVAYDPEERAEVEAARTIPFTDADREPVVVEVDYSEGRDAAWWPKGESPLLSDLVEAGDLPPVEERVGPEPVVIRGQEGIGNYGGTLVGARDNRRNVGMWGQFYAGDLLVRYSPTGEPIVPHVAKSWEIRDGGREYIFHLRKGMKWSDGHPFTADDILYHWEHEVNNPNVSTGPRRLMEHRGKQGEIVKIDDYTIAFRFEDPNSLLLGQLAGPDGMEITRSPAHYLRQYHPDLGDPEVIEAAMKAWQMPTPRALYSALKAWDNPKHPRLWPYLFRSWKGTPPYSWVRNPYYYAVDPEGNQLPYIDRYLWTIKNADLIPIAAANGELPLTGGLGMEHYTILMNQREKGNYDVRYYSYGGGSRATIWPNQTKKRDPSDPDAAKKEEIMRKKEFRQALSLAINREAIIEVEFSGLTEPSQIGPPPYSPHFNENLYYAFVDYDPARANALLDSIGLTRRDAEGYRTFFDGSPMTFYMIYITGSSISGAMAQSIVEDWAEIGVRVIYQERGTNLFWVEVEGMLHDMMAAGVSGEQFAILNPRNYIPRWGSFYAYGWGFWNLRGGYYGNEVTGPPEIGPPPEGHPLWEAMDLYDKVIQTLDEDEQNRLFQRILDIAAENLWSINIAEAPPILQVVSRDLMNVPERSVQAWHMLSPANRGWETYSFRNPSETEGAIEQMKESILRPLGNPPGAGTEVAAVEGEPTVSSNGGIPWFRYGFSLLLVAGVLFAGIRYPYIGRRLLLMIPTLFIVSILVFVIIQLPPGDYSTSMIAQAQAMGEESDLQKIEEVIEIFELEDGWMTRYLSWTGLRWFFTFDAEDRGLLQGDLGRSMENLEPVSEVMGDRALLTVFISFSTVLFTWVVALPIGIYSAVRQYSTGDYIVTVIGFLGMCVPNFLLALLLMYFSSAFLGINVTGLFSAEYAGQPEWTVGKFIDLLQHLWVPVVVIGTAGTASMIRVMRGNLLDELKKPYVTTARAKGVRPIKLILKYPVRLALNPFISGIGHIFPQLISGGAIVALILSLPTVGPLLLESLLLEDMYMAGSLLMILSTLGIVGTLVSDLLLMALDPRIRMGGGSR